MLFSSIELRNITLRGNLYVKQSEDGRSILLESLENAYFTVDQVSVSFYRQGLMILITLSGH